LVNDIPTVGLVYLRLDTHTDESEREMCKSYFSQSHSFKGARIADSNGEGCREHHDHPPAGYDFKALGKSTRQFISIPFLLIKRNAQNFAFSRSNVGTNPDHKTNQKNLTARKSCFPKNDSCHFSRNFLITQLRFGNLPFLTHHKPPSLHHQWNAQSRQHTRAIPSHYG